MLKKVSDEVLRLLRKNPAYRDDDNRLVAQFWSEHLGATKDQMTAFDLLKLISLGQVEKADNITRARRKLQEEYPELRGTVWNKRHNHQEVVKKELKEITPQSRMAI